MCVVALGDKLMEYEIIRSSRKTIAIQIKAGGRVIVRAPLRSAKKDIERIVGQNRDWIEKNIKRLEEMAGETPNEPSDEQIKEYKRLAKAIIPQKVEYFSRIMGVTPTGITITSAKTRFGSCSPKNSLSFSWRLMQYEESEIDYVVVHELAHIRHHDHSKAFYAVVASVMPDYKERQAVLKKPPKV